MRLLSILLLVIFMAPSVFAQSEDDLVGWFIDDFESTTFDQRWKEISGNWGLDGENVVAKITRGDAVLTNETYIMRTKPYIIDAMIQGAGGGVVFCLENREVLRDGHLALPVGQGWGVEELGDALPPLDLQEQHPVAAAGQGQGQCCGHCGLAGAALPGDHVQSHARPVRRPPAHGVQCRGMEAVRTRSQCPRFAL